MLFFVSGFSGLIYQVVWVRLAFASFGIITPVLSDDCIGLHARARRWARGPAVVSQIPGAQNETCRRFGFTLELN